MNAWQKTILWRYNFFSKKLDNEMNGEEQKLYFKGCKLKGYFNFLWNIKDTPKISKSEGAVSGSKRQKIKMEQITSEQKA